MSGEMVRIVGFAFFLWSSSVIVPRLVWLSSGAFLALLAFSWDLLVAPRRRRREGVQTTPNAPSQATEDLSHISNAWTQSSRWRRSGFAFVQRWPKCATRATWGPRNSRLDNDKTNTPSSASRAVATGRDLPGRDSGVVHLLVRNHQLQTVWSSRWLQSGKRTSARNAMPVACLRTEDPSHGLYDYSFFSSVVPAFWATHLALGGMERHTFRCISSGAERIHCVAVSPQFSLPMTNARVFGKFHACNVCCPKPSTPPVL